MYTEFVSTEWLADMSMFCKTLVSMKRSLVCDGQRPRKLGNFLVIETKLTTILKYWKLLFGGKMKFYTVRKLSIRMLLMTHTHEHCF